MLSAKLRKKKITWVVMEYLPICIPDDVQLTEYQATFLAYDVISGLDHLHMNQIAHLDVYLDNILATRANKQENKVCYKTIIDDIVQQLETYNSSNQSGKELFSINPNFSPGSDIDSNVNSPEPEFYQYVINNLSEQESNVFEGMNFEIYSKSVMKNSKGDNVNPEVFPYMDTLESNEIPNLKLSLEIMCLNPKNKPNDICLLIVLSNDMFYVTYKEKLFNI